MFFLTQHRSISVYTVVLTVHLPLESHNFATAGYEAAVDNSEKEELTF